MTKKKYYDITKILETHAQYMILLGQRANGKSYQAKKTVLEDAYKNKTKFVYLRRWQEDIKAKAVNAYFGDIPISKITKGEYTDVVAWNGDLFFATRDEKGAFVKGQHIGRYCALNEYERYKSWAFVGYAYIIYEEFITDKTYLDNEPKLLQQFVSTVARLEGLTVLLIGNTMSRVCPYFSEWCLDGVLKQKQGTIEIYHFHVKDTIIDIAVEYCANADFENKMFFGQASRQILSGEWDTVDCPRLPKQESEYDLVYEILVEFQKFKFCMRLLVSPETGGFLVYIYPYTGHRHIDRVITDVMSDNPLVTSCLDMRRKAEEIISNCFRMNKVCYSDNLTGADFSHVNDYLKIR